MRNPAFGPVMPRYPSPDPGSPTAAVPAFWSTKASPSPGFALAEAW